MRYVWMVLLAGCGFQRSGATTDVGPDSAMAVDAMLDASSSGPAPVTCWTISDTSFHLSACPTALAGSIDVTTDVSIDTDANVVPPSGLGCAPLSSTSFPVCALAAGTITIEAGKTLSAHGKRPLALLGHAITINGTVDVASHVTGGQRGPASIALGCNPNGTLATNSGGGAGGTYGLKGGKGGDEGGGAGTGGPQGFTIGIAPLRGGCDGGRGGDASATGGPAGVGGAGGGAVWIALDKGTLLIGSGARINASGAGGVGGAGSSGADHGGNGGGSGGMILLQAPMIMLDGSAQIFANGGHGGGGAQSAQAGHDGSDPTGAASGGGGGDGGISATVGAGGSGYPASGASLNGANGDAPTHSGGGGGGGGAGAIRVASSTAISGTNVSPPPAKLTP